MKTHKQSFDCFTGKACSKNAGRYISEEEELDTISDTRSMDILANSSSMWMRNVAKRHAQVAPDGGYHRCSVGNAAIYQILKIKENSLRS